MLSVEESKGVPPCLRIEERVIGRKRRGSALLAASLALCAATSIGVANAATTSTSADRPYSFVDDTCKTDDAWTSFPSGQQWTASYSRLGTNYTVTAYPSSSGSKAVILVPAEVSDGNQSWGYVYQNGTNSGTTNKLYRNGSNASISPSATIAQCGRSLRSQYDWSGLRVTQTLTVTADGEIVHEWTLTNTSSSPFTGTVAPSIDTDLNNADSVPLYSDGVGGVYMSGSGYTLAMDPINGLSAMYAGTWSTNKGSSWHNTAGLPADQTVVSGVDSATYYETPNLSLAQNESYTFSFKENTYKAGEYRVVLDGNGGTFNGDPTNSLWVKSGDKAMFNHTPTYTKHTLKGWSTSKDGSAGLFDANTPITSNITLYAQWELTKHKVSFDSNGGTLTSSDSTTVTDGDTAAKPSNPTRTGYDFSGWFTSETGGTKYDFNDEVTEPVALYAHWKAHTYQIAYYPNSGSGSMDKQKLTYDDAENLTANAFSKPGYSFIGWNTKGNGTGTAYSNSQNVLNLSADNNAIINLYAQWEADPQSITYEGNANGVVGSVNSTDGVTDQTVDVAPNGFTRDGYRFDCWNTKPDGTGTTYQPGDHYVLPAGGLTLYAQWRGLVNTMPHTGGNMNIAVPIVVSLALAALGGLGFLYARKRRMNRI